MRSYRSLIGRGLFTALELTVILGVLGIVATIVGPRMSRAAGSSLRVGEQVLEGQLRAFREAIEAYADAHGGRGPDGDAARVVRQLTEYTDWSGNVSPTRTARHWMGPYLRDIPPLPVGAKKGVTTLCVLGDPALADAAWVYEPITRRIWAVTGDGSESGVSGKY